MKYWYASKLLIYGTTLCKVIEKQWKQYNELRAEGATITKSPRSLFIMSTTWLKRWLLITMNALKIKQFPEIFSMNANRCSAAGGLQYRPAADPIACRGRSADQLGWLNVTELIMLQWVSFQSYNQRLSFV